jgi:hypothetical protein
MNSRTLRSQVLRDVLVREGVRPGDVDIGQAEAAARLNLVEDVDGAAAQLLRVKDLAGRVGHAGLRGRRILRAGLRLLRRGRDGGRGRRRRRGRRGRARRGGRRVDGAAGRHLGEEMALLLQTDLEAAAALLDGRVVDRAFAQDGQQLALPALADLVAGDADVHPRADAARDVDGHEVALRIDREPVADLRREVALRD